MSHSVISDPQVGFEVSSLSVSEGATSVEVTITASGATFVELYLEDGTAQGEQHKWYKADGYSPLLPFFLLPFLSPSLSHTHFLFLSF